VLLTGGLVRPVWKPARVLDYGAMTTIERKRAAMLPLDHESHGRGTWTVFAGDAENSLRVFG